MFDILYNAYNGLIYCTTTRDVTDKCDIKEWARDMSASNSSRALLLPGSTNFPHHNLNKCYSCSFGNRDGCCKVLTLDHNYDASGFANKYRINIDDDTLIDNHSVSVKFYSLDNNEEFVYNDDYKAYLFKSNAKAVISFYYCDVFDESFDNKKISFDISGAISYKTITTVNGVAQNNILFSGNVSSGNIKICGDGNGNSLDFIPTNVLNIKYVMVKE